MKHEWVARGRKSYRMRLRSRKGAGITINFSDLTFSDPWHHAAGMPPGAASAAMVARIRAEERIALELHVRNPFSILKVSGAI